MTTTGLFRDQLKTKLLVIAALFVFNSYASSQCVPKTLCYKPGEIIEYEAYYNWGLIWLNAGWIRFSVKNATYKNQEVYLLDAFGTSHESYDWLFKVRDYFKSYVDPETMQPLYAHRDNYEGGYVVDNKYTFDWENNQIFSATQNSDKPYSEDTIKIPPCTFDLISAVYYTRNLNFDNIKIGEKRPVTSIVDNEVFDLYVRYLGKEKVEDREGNSYNCRKFSVLLIEGTIFKGGEDMFVWVTDDDNRIPILIEAKILIGSVKAYIRRIEGIKYPEQLKSIRE